MVISSFILESCLADLPLLINKLSEVEGVEIHKVVDNTKIIITLEKATTDESYRTGDLISKLPEVTHLCLVYTNFEDEVRTQGGTL